MKLVEAAQPEDRGAILQVLTATGLPTSDLSDGTSVDFFVVRDEGNIVGVIGLERAGSHALLRSLAVHPDARDRGLGHTLVEAIQQHAVSEGITTLFLLTTAAAGYFSQCGYRRVDRASAPVDIQATEQFAGLCPASAVLMVKELESKQSPGY